MTERSRKNISSHSKLAETGRAPATYRIKSTSKNQSTKYIRAADPYELRTLESRVDTGRKKELVAMLERRREDPRCRTTAILKLKKQAPKHEDANESSLMISQRMQTNTNMRSEATMQT